MSTIGEAGKRWAWITGIRAVLMLLAGLYALFWPGAALTVLVIWGGVLLVVDGALGLWSLTFGGAKTGNFWFDVVRNALALIAGVLILLSIPLSALFAAVFLTTIIGIQAIIVGVMEIVVVLRERSHYMRVWPVLLSGIVYVLFGIVVLLYPVMSSLFFISFAGVLMILFSIGLFGLAFRLNRTASGTP